MEFLKFNVYLYRNMYVHFKVFVFPFLSQTVIELRWGGFPSTQR
jgi:hypothetical protein